MRMSSLESKDFDLVHDDRNFRHRANNGLETLDRVLAGHHQVDENEVEILALRDDIDRFVKICGLYDRRIGGEFRHYLPQARTKHRVIVSD